MATIANIIQSQRASGATRTGSILTALGAKTKEKLDPRNYLFKRTGTLTSLFPSLKGYQASVAKDTANKLKTGDSGIQAEVMTSRLDEISKDIKNVSKNTLALPIIAKEINIMRQNIALLVKANKETPRTRATSYFESSLAKESAIEAARTKPETTTSPTQIGSVEKENSKGFFGSLMSGILGKAALGGLAGLGIAYFLSDNFKTKVKSFLDNIFNSILGEETWGSVKNLLSNIVEALKTSIMKIGGEAMEAAGITESSVKSGMVKGGAALAGGVAAGSAISGRLKSGQEKLSGKIKDVNQQQTKDAIQKGKNAFSKIFKKGGLSALKTFGFAVVKKFGLGIPLKIFGMFAGMIVTGPIGIALSLALIASNIYLVYKIIDMAEEFYKDNFGDKEPELKDTQPEKITPMTSDDVAESIGGVKTSPDRAITTSPTKLPDTRGLSKMDLSGLSNEQLQMANLIYQKFTEAGFTPEQALGAIKNAYAESKLNPNASNTNGEDSWGLFQMNRSGGLGSGYTPEQLKNPEVNIGLAIAEALKSDRFKNATTVAEATEAFMKDVEKPYDQSSFAVAQRVAGLSTESPAMIAQSPQEMLSQTLKSSMNDLSMFMNNLQSNINGDKMKEFSNEFEELIRDFMKPNESGTTNVVNNSPTNVNNVSGNRGNIASTYNNEYISNYMLHKNI